jgi:hypothetical protein
VRGYQVYLYYLYYLQIPTIVIQLCMVQVRVLPVYSTLLLVYSYTPQLFCSSEIRTGTRDEQLAVLLL